MDFHTYENEIVKCLIDLGFNVKKVTDKPHKKRGYDTFTPESKKKKDQIAHQFKLLKDLNDSYDVVLVFVGRFIQRFFLEGIKKKNPNAKMILYLWDDLARVENFDQVKDLYDEIITFELNDSIKYGYRFVPLYYMPQFKTTLCDKKYDVCTISSNHSDRIELMRKIIASSPNNWRFNFIVVVSLASYVKYFFSKYRKSDKKGGLCFTIKPKTIEETAKIMSESKAILDLQHFTQKGLTNRTLESLGSGIKLITSNEQVKYYDFYKPNNIFVIDRKNPTIDDSFLETPYEGVPNKIYNEYSLENWLRAILFKDKYIYLNNDIESISKSIAKGEKND